VGQEGKIDPGKIETFADAIKAIEFLLGRVSRLEAENRELKEEIATLKKDSSNSSKPPSSDITQPPHKRKQKGKRKQGAQKDRKPTFREALPPEEVDETQKLKLEHCPDCGKKLSNQEHADVLVQQTAELSVAPVKVTEYHRRGCLCEDCGFYYYPHLPQGVIEGQLFGPRLQALIGYMKGNLGASYTELEQYCKDVLGITVSRGMLCKVISRVSEALKIPYEELGESLVNEESLHIDETGWKDNGTSHWVWVFCNSVIAYFTIASSRGSKVLKQVLGETFDGAIISDFFSAYTCYANPKQQFCLAHLIRDIKFLTTLPDECSQEFGAKVLSHFRSVFNLWHRRAEYPPGEFEKKADRLQRKLYTYLSKVQLPKGKACTLKKRLIKRWENLFCFFTDPALFQPTNNAAEQILRHLIRIRRNSQGSRSQMGMQWNARAETVLQTCRKQNRSPWEFIKKSVEAFHFNADYPTLLRKL
jgi:transposase